MENGASALHFPLLERVAEARGKDDSVLLDLFLEYLADKKLELYPAQEEAILALFEGSNVILNTPTGSGKSLVATALHYHSIANKRRSYYTCPIKALVNEKFIALCKEFGPDNVGMVTGDASVNRDAPIICCTAEILSNIALREGAHAAVDDVIMDEFHYYSDRERGIAWQVPLLTLPQARFLLMSATLGDTQKFEVGLKELTGRSVAVVRSAKRPVPLEFTYSEDPLHEVVPSLIANGRSPVYVVHFTQRDAADGAQNFLSIDFCTKDEKKKIAEALTGFRFSSPYGKDIARLLKHGIGIHHAGLLPKYRILVEKLAQQGMLKIICGTDTLGVGVNVPIRTVLFTKLCKFDGEKTAILTVRDFQQIAGRAGRKGFDDKGYVLAQAPEHIIENIRMEQKAAGDPKKMKKLVKRKPPEKGFIPWGRDTFEKLISSPPEQLTSRFFVTHGMLLNVLSRQGDGCRAVRDLIKRSDESEYAKKKHRAHAFKLFRALLERNLIELVGDKGRESKIRVNVDLQNDFSLNQALSLYLIDTLKLLDIAAPSYPLDVLSLVEAIIENPDAILRRQIDKIKTIKMAEMRAQGVEFSERVEKLDDIEYPKPNREFIYSTFNDFARIHPWVASENIRPKSVAREMYEHFFSFADYIREYGLQRSEGMLLRYLSDAYKAMSQTVPDLVKTDEIYEIESYFAAMIRQVDSSLLDEWEKLKNPNFVREEVEGHSHAHTDITRDERNFKVLVRNQIFFVIRAIAMRDVDTVLSLIEPLRLEDDAAWTAEQLENQVASFYAAHQRLRTDQEARRVHHTYFSPALNKKSWHVVQALIDEEDANDWCAEFTVDIEKSRESGKAVLFLDRIGAVT